MKCKFCGYEWTPRATNPKQCPLCKRYLIVKEKSVNTRIRTY